MCLRIETPNIPLYRPGMAVSGSIFLATNSDVVVDHISVVLSGLSKSEVIMAGDPPADAGTIPYIQEVQLFYQEQNLFRGPGLFHPNHSWPFAFTFPENCNASPISGVFIWNKEFNCDNQQILPPSFESCSPRSSCEVGYQLTARLSLSYVERGSRCREFRQSLSLRFMPYRKILDVDPAIHPMSCFVSFRSMRLLPGREDSPISILERFMSLRTEKPKVSFSVKVTTPQVTLLGRLLPIALSAHHDMQQSTCQVLPRIMLRKFSVVLQTTTFLHCLDGWEHHDNWDSERKVVGRNFSKDLIPKYISEIPLDMRYLVPSLKLDPHFNNVELCTFNVRTTQCLKIKLEIECAGKIFKLELPKCTDFPLSVLPPDREPAALYSGSSSAAEAERAEDSLSGSELSLPPAYSQADFSLHV